MHKSLLPVFTDKNFFISLTLVTEMEFFFPKYFLTLTSYTTDSVFFFFRFAS